MSDFLITAPGAYPDIPNDVYHRAANLLPGPSLSSTGAKMLLEKSPLHFWAESPMNPDRPPESEKPHFNVGKAAHDMILLGGNWRDSYHVLPEGFNAGHSNKWAEAIEARDHAVSKGKSVLRYQDAQTVEQVADAIGLNRDARNALSAGEPELTIVHKDDETGIWRRVRPDWTPFSVINGADVMVASDLKFMASTHCSPQGFARAIASFGYHQSAAWYEDGYLAVYGRAPTHWLFVVIEKEYPFDVAVYELPRADIERGRAQNRIAIRKFADCLSRGTERQFWPGYSSQSEHIEMVGLPGWARNAIDQHGSIQAAALVNSAGE